MCIGVTAVPVKIIWSKIKKVYFHLPVPFPPISAFVSIAVFSMVMRGVVLSSTFK